MTESVVNNRLNDFYGHRIGNRALIVGAMVKSFIKY